MRKKSQNTVTAEQLVRWDRLCRPFRGVIWTDTWDPGTKVLRIDPEKQEGAAEKHERKSSPGYDPELEVLCLPIKYGAQMVERCSRPLPTKDGYVQYVNTVQGGKEKYGKNDKCR